MSGKIKCAEEFIYEMIQVGLFEVDSRGRIWRLATKSDTIGKNKNFRRRAEFDNTHYLQITCCVAGRKVFAQASRVVWRNFNGPIPANLTINHKNGDKKDNRLSNLELATDSEQSLHAIKKLGWNAKSNFGMDDFRGVKNGRAKLSETQVRSIRNSKEKLAPIAAKFNISMSVVSAIRNGKKWTHVL